MQADWQENSIKKSFESKAPRKWFEISLFVILLSGPKVSWSRFSDFEWKCRDFKFLFQFLQHNYQTEQIHNKTFHYIGSLISFLEWLSWYLHFVIQVMLSLYFLGLLLQLFVHLTFLGRFLLFYLIFLLVELIGPSNNFLA